MSQHQNKIFGKTEAAGESQFWLVWFFFSPELHSGCLYGHRVGERRSRNLFYFLSVFYKSSHLLCHQCKSIQCPDIAPDLPLVYQRSDTLSQRTSSCFRAKVALSLPNIIPITWSVIAYCSCPSFSVLVSFTCKLALKI